MRQQSKEYRTQLAKSKAVSESSFAVMPHLHRQPDIVNLHFKSWFYDVSSF